MARETDVEALWRSLSKGQRQVALEMLLREITVTYERLDDEAKIQWSGPLFTLIEILERLRRQPADAERLSTLEVIELGCRFTGQISAKQPFANEPDSA